jgi:LAO/AO transport system kinase
VKRGIVELADLVVVNKADGALADLARHTAGDYGNALHLLRPRTDGWSARVLSCSALLGEGIGAVCDAVEEFMDLARTSGGLVARRGEQAREWMWSEVNDGLLEALAADPAVASEMSALEEDVVVGAAPPTAAARQLLERFSTDPVSRRTAGRNLRAGRALGELLGGIRAQGARLAANSWEGFPSLCAGFGQLLRGFLSPEGFR